MSCPRCQGLLISTFDREDPLYCSACAWRPNPPHVEPIMTNPFRKWVAGICEICGGGARRGKPTCLGCAAKERGQRHGEAIRLGMENARRRVGGSCRD